MMHSISILLSLTAAASASMVLHYVVPSNFKAAATGNCTLPSEFVVTNFTTYTDKNDESLDTVLFDFADPDTEIQATCWRNSTSTPSGPGKNRFGCSNPNIAFIYQMTGVSGLTIAERACPSASGTGFEASGLIAPELDCADTDTGTLCHAKQDSINGDFDSFQPIPPEAPKRRDRITWRG